MPEFAGAMSAFGSVMTAIFFAIRQMVIGSLPRQRQRSFSLRRRQSADNVIALGTLLRTDSPFRR